jgi:hypothetical protein
VFVSEWSKCDFYLLSGAARFCGLPGGDANSHAMALRSFVVPTGLWGHDGLALGPSDYFKLALFLNSSRLVR